MTQTTLTLADFLVARIAEDEATARLAAGAPARYGPTPRWVVGESNNDGIRRDDGIPVTRHTWPYEADHITRHDPARVLAECEAKRRIVEGIRQFFPHQVVEDCWYTCVAATEGVDGGECCDDARRGGSCDCGAESRANSLFKLLALPYSDHPDYRDEWRP